MCIRDRYEWVNESFYASAQNLSLRGFCDGTILVQSYFYKNMVQKTIIIVFPNYLVINFVIFHNPCKVLVSGVYNYFVKRRCELTGF